MPRFEPLAPLWVAWLGRANFCNCNCNINCTIPSTSSPSSSPPPCRGLALRPLAPETKTMTALEHLERHRCLALHLGIKLHQLEAPGANRRAIMDSIKKLLDRCARWRWLCAPGHSMPWSGAHRTLRLMQPAPVCSAWHCIAVPVRRVHMHGRLLIQKQSQLPDATAALAAASTDQTLSARCCAHLPVAPSAACLFCLLHVCLFICCLQALPHAVVPHHPRQAGRCGRHKAV